MSNRIMMNPFDDFKTVKDIILFSHYFIQSTSCINGVLRNKCLVRIEETWLNACFFLIVSTCKNTDLMNMDTVFLLLDSTRKKNLNAVSKFDELFIDLKRELNQKKNIDNSFSKMALKYYKLFQLVIGNQEKTIMKSIEKRLFVFHELR